MSDCNCENCGTGFRQQHRTDSRFCSSKCRSQWHRTHDPDGVVRSVRRMTNGRVSVTLHFSNNEAERALQLGVGERAVVGAVERK